MKLTPKEIIEGYNLIAEFAELPKCTDPKHIDDPCFFVEGKYRKVHELQYDSSWNSLMPAIQKWDTLPKFSEAWIQEEYIERCEELDNRVITYQIEPVFQKFIECLKWYNIRKS